MKKRLLTIFMLAAVLTPLYESQAFVRYEEKNPKKVTELKMTGYIDYAPFGYVDNPGGIIYGEFHTVFQPMLDTFVKEANLKLQYDVQQKTFDDLAQKVRQGDIDFLVGAYYKTEMFRGLHLIYPAALYNPITVFMLPDRINDIKTTDDLKKYKGVRNTNELFSDFVDKKVAELNPIEVNSSYEMFQKLFTREADYAITSYYYGMLEAIKMGIQYQVSPAKQTIWNIPMFVGVSKTSRHRDMISRYLTRYLNDKNNLDILQQNLQQMIKDFQVQYSGVVPPDFGVENKMLSESNDTAEKADNNLDDK